MIVSKIYVYSHAKKHSTIGTIIVKPLHSS